MIRPDTPPGDQAALLIFRVGPVYCCAPSGPVASIIVPPPLHRPPGSNPDRPGVFRHDRQLVSVIDLRQRFGVPESGRSEPGRLIITNLAQGHTGFRVDAIVDVEAMPDSGWGGLPALLPRGVFRSTLLQDERIHLYAEFDALAGIPRSGYLREWLAEVAGTEAGNEPAPSPAIAPAVKTRIGATTRRDDRPASGPATAPTGTPGATDPKPGSPPDTKTAAKPASSPASSPACPSISAKPDKPLPAATTTASPVPVASTGHPGRPEPDAGRSGAGLPGRRHASRGQVPGTGRYPTGAAVRAANAASAPRSGNPPARETAPVTRPAVPVGPAPPPQAGHDGLSFLIAGAVLVLGIALLAWQIREPGETDWKLAQTETASALPSPTGLPFAFDSDSGESGGESGTPTRSPGRSPLQSPAGPAGDRPDQGEKESWTSGGMASIEATRASESGTPTQSTESESGTPTQLPGRSPLRSPAGPAGDRPDQGEKESWTSGGMASIEATRAETSAFEPATTGLGAGLGAVSGDAGASESGTPTASPAESPAESGTRTALPPLEPAAESADTGRSVVNLPSPRNAFTPSAPGHARIERDAGGITIVLNAPASVSVSETAAAGPSSRSAVSTTAAPTTAPADAPASGFVPLRGHRANVSEATACEPAGETPVMIPARPVANPESATPPPATPQRHEIVHLVVRGDTLWDIAARYIHDPFRYPELARLSKIRNPDLIYPGDRVRIIRYEETAPD